MGWMEAVGGVIKAYSGNNPEVAFWTGIALGAIIVSKVQFLKKNAWVVIAVAVLLGILAYIGVLNAAAAAAAGQAVVDNA